MNERIRELAKQAGFSSWVLNPSVETQSDTPELLNRFAELIVRECIELSKQELAFNAFERMLNKYKEHFGVIE